MTTEKTLRRGEKEHDLLIEFDIEPEQVETFDDPGFPVNCLIWSARLHGRSVLKCLTDAEIEFLRDAILRDLEG